MDSIPSTVAVGALLSLGVISGAIFFHLTRLGIALTAVDDHGELFVLAVIVLVCSLGVLFLHRAEIPVIGRIFFTQDPIVYLTIAIFFGVNYVLFRTMLGLRIRSVGELLARRVVRRGAGVPRPRAPSSGSARASACAPGANVPNRSELR